MSLDGIVVVYFITSTGSASCLRYRAFLYRTGPDAGSSLASQTLFKSRGELT